MLARGEASACLFRRSQGDDTAALYRQRMAFERHAARLHRYQPARF
jgi:hypothetical protein